MENAYAGTGLLLTAFIVGIATGVVATLDILQYNGVIYLHI
jgi:hypothetical protein